MKLEDVRMEHINFWVIDLLDKIQYDVGDYPEEKEDELFDDVRNALEKFFNYPDYRKYN